MSDEHEARRAMLLSERERLTSKAVATNTQLAYESRWSSWVDWCEHSVGIDPLGADEHDFSLYVADLVTAGAKVSTIKQARAAVKRRYEDAGKISPTTGKVVRDTISGAERELGTAVSKSRALTPDELAAMFQACGDRVSATRDRAMLLVWFYAALRRSELAALDREDIARDRNGLLVHIRRSKTDQEGRGVDIPIARVGGVLCPEAAWREWSPHLAPGMPAFPSVSKSGRPLRRMNPSSLVGVLERLARDAGVDVEKLSPHSMRAGFITQAAIDRHSPHFIADISRHKDMNVLDGYIRPVSIWDNPILQQPR